jgi:hypothetical protein
VTAPVLVPPPHPPGTRHRRAREIFFIVAGVAWAAAALVLRRSPGWSRATRNHEPSPAEHFWTKEEWCAVLPDTVLAHHAFRQDGKKKCERHWHSQAVALLVVSASIPVVAVTGVSRVVIAGLGALATVLAGLGELFQWRENVMRENRSMMQIQQELVRWKAGMSHYKTVKTKPADATIADGRTLSARVEDIVQTEGDAWASTLGQLALNQGNAQRQAQ